MNEELPRLHPLPTWSIEASGAAVPAAVRGAGPITATVPGCAHTDLLAAGLIDDPYLDQNEELQSWIGLTDWTYRTTFDWIPDGATHHELRFGGIDTVSTVSLNGRALGTTRNMHRTHVFEVTDVLRPGVNEITVAIESPIRAADAASVSLGPRPHVNHHPYNALRKMACSFGWDWGIDTSTSGLWRPVELVSWSRARMADVRVAGDVIDGVPSVRFDARVESDAAAELSFDVTVGIAHFSLPATDGAVSAVLPVPSAALWWPRGHGEPNLHEVTVALIADDTIVDRRHWQMGFRSVELRLTPDDQGTGFAIVVNGSVIHVKGANWIPDDAFLHRVDRDRYAARLAHAEFAGINLLRVWGGGIFESEDFYDECDRRGILTWQDFLFACAAYAEEEPLRTEIAAEAREAIVRLGAHPSLIILNGNNENIWGHQDWGWERRLDGLTWGAGYYYDLLPGLVSELAPHVAYTPGSPFSPDPDAPQNDPAHATTHVWDLWNTRDWPDYRAYRPRFVAEFGWQGPPAWSTLTRAVSDDPLTPESPGMLVHQKAARGNDKLHDGLVGHFPIPYDMDDWHWAMSLNQALAIRTAIEWYRSLTPHCTGTVVWQLNDSWPVTSWSAVDGYGRAKPLLHALRAAHADRLLTIQPEGDALRVALINDSDIPWHDGLRIERRDYEGNLLATDARSVRVAARGTGGFLIDAALSAPSAPDGEFLVARTSDTRAIWFYADYRDTRLAAAALDIDARPTDDGWALHVSARSLVRDLTFCVDRVDPDAATDRALDTLLPGESLIVRVTGARGATPDDFRSPLVARSANDLVVERP